MAAANIAIDTAKGEAAVSRGETRGAKNSGAIVLMLVVKGARKLDRARQRDSPLRVAMAVAAARRSHRAAAGKRRAGRTAVSTASEAAFVAESNELI